MRSQFSTAPPPSYTLLVTTDLPLRPPRKPFYFPQNSVTYPPQVINNDLLPPPPPPPPKKKIVFILLLFFKLFFFLWNVVVLTVGIYVF